MPAVATNLHNESRQPTDVCILPMFTWAAVIAWANELLAYVHEWLKQNIQPQHNQFGSYATTAYEIVVTVLF